MTPRVTVNYVAMLRESAGKADEHVVILKGETAATLYTRLSQQYSFGISAAALRVAINDTFQTFDCELHDSDRVVFIPPVAGG